MPRKEQGWITFQSSEEERQILEQYCQQSQRSKTEILRELVRNLPPVEQPGQPAEAPVVSEALVETIPPANPTLKSIKVSARNILQGTVKQITLGAVNAEVAVEIAPGVELVSSITRTSAEQLGLCKGKAVYAVIKSSSIMIAEG